MPKQRKIVGELKELIAQDIAAGKKRGLICKERGVSYLMLQAEFGFTCKKPRKPAKPEATPPVEGWPKAAEPVN